MNPFIQYLRLPLLPFLCLLAAEADAVTIESGAIDNQALFGIEFPDGGRAYYSREDGLRSVSMQEYRTATFSVVEINLVADSTALLRIYHSRPLGPAELREDLDNAGGAAGAPTSSIIRRPLPPGVQAMADRASGVSEALTSSTVIKEYPFATHAHTIEYRMRSRKELFELFDELKMHWLKEPAYFENGQIVDSTGEGDREMQPRSLGGTLFQVEN